MKSTNTIILTCTNYFQWKSHKEDILRSKGICIITLGLETAPTDAKNKAKWDNTNYSTHCLIGMSISLDLRFHIDGLDSLIEAWKKFEYCLWPQKWNSLSLAWKWVTYLGPE